VKNAFDHILHTFGNRIASVVHLPDGNDFLSKNPEPSDEILINGTKNLLHELQRFDVEQFIFCKPGESDKYYKELLKNSEEILKKLKLPYRIIEICSGDLADWKYRSADLEVYRPTTKKYEEVMSLSNCTDYQARKLEIKYVDKKGSKKVIHTLNDTALATSRIIVAILENFQTKSGSIKIPSCLWKYTGFKEIKAGKK
jgi:seryl-tRNA synthetase